MSKFYSNIYNHDQFNKTIDNLIYNEFIRYENLNNRKVKIQNESLRKCGWLASLLANSPVEEHKQKAQLFASLIYLQDTESVSGQQLSYIINSRAGNLTATRFLKYLFNESNSITDQRFSGSFGSLLDAELGLERLDKIVTVKGDSFLTTDFQKGLWENLSLKNKISVSAPTSSGKSFVIQKFIQKEFSNAEKLRVLYIVSSKALLSQVSEGFRIILDRDVDIKTSFIADKDKELPQKQIFILTPERCLRLLQQNQTSDFKIDIIFIDEIQNVENEEGRGVLMEYILNEISDLWKDSKIITAGPFIDNNKELFHDLFNSNCDEVKTNKSPVFQIKTIVSPLNSEQLSIEILSSYELSKRTRLKVNVDFNPEVSLRNLGGFLSNIVQLFGKTGQNIIYSPKTDLAQKWALQLAKKLPAPNDISIELKELIEFLEDEIHPKYYLITCLKKRVAFHHGRLPDIVRKEIEDLYVENKIQDLYCTSTLLEGVNLPANNLFLITPKKKTSALTSFEFGNLIGRAGRIKDSLFGTIYCIQKENETWAEQYYSKPFNKDVTSSNQKALVNINSLIPEFSKPILEIKNDRDKNTIVFLRHKYLKGEEELNKYLKTKLSLENSNKVIPLIKNSVQNLALEYTVIKLNPTIDPILQHTLYTQIKKDGVDNWCVIVNSNFYKRITKENIKNFRFNEMSLFWQLSIILEKLDKIFEISKETFFKHDISLSIKSMCVYGVQWLENRSYKELILEDLRFRARHINPKKRIDINNEEQVNQRINEIIKIHSTVTTYILVKYLKVLNDIVAYVLGENPDEKYSFTLALPTMLELGSTKGTAIQLISKGVNRSVALKVVKEFERIPGHEALDIFNWLRTQRKLNLKSIYNRYLRKLNLLYTENSN